MPLNTLTRVITQQLQQFFNVTIRLLGNYVSDSYSNHCMAKNADQFPCKASTVPSRL
jgi:hypothetical protein